MSGTDDKEQSDLMQSPEERARDTLLLGPESVITLDSMYSQIGAGRIYEQAYKELCEIVTGEVASDTPPDEAEFAEKVLEYLGSRRDELHQRICVEFDYCAKRKKYGSSSRMLQALLGLLIIILDSTSLGAASASWLLGQEVLDKLCGCDSK